MFHKLHAAKYSTSRQVRVYCKKYHCYHHHRYHYQCHRQSYYWFLQHVLWLGCNHGVFWQEQWLITYSQTAASAVWLIVVHDGRCSQEELLCPHQWSSCPRWTHRCIYKDYFLNSVSLHPLKAECPPGCKSGLRMLAQVFFLILLLLLLLKMLLFCICFVYCFTVFTEKQINCQVKTMERKQKKSTAFEQNIRTQTGFFSFSNLNKTDFFIQMVHVTFSTRLSWLVKLVHPLQMDRLAGKWQRRRI